MIACSSSVIAFIREEVTSESLARVLGERSSRLKLQLLILHDVIRLLLPAVELNNCERLIKLDVSSNCLTCLPADLKLSRLPFLRVVYLHNNEIRERAHLGDILACQQIIHLTLFSNPFASTISFRHDIVNTLKCLKCLDFNLVLEQERECLLSCHGEFFKARSRLDWPVVVMANDGNHHSRAFAEREMLTCLRSELSIITSRHSRCSYVLTI